MLIRSIKATIFKKLLSRIFAFFLKVLHICYTWPLGHRKKPLFKGFVNSWCRQQELNPQPTDYDSVALPIELCRQRAWISYENTADMSIFFPRFVNFQSECNRVLDLFPLPSFVRGLLCAFEDLRDRKFIVSGHRIRGSTKFPFIRKIGDNDFARQAYDRAFFQVSTERSMV